MRQNEIQNWDVDIPKVLKDIFLKYYWVGFIEINEKYEETLQNCVWKN